MKTVYTAIFGKYDDLKEPATISREWRYVCFTDQNFKSDVWEIIRVPVMECGPAKTARYYKIMFHKHIESEFSIWIDGTFVINTDLNRWWKRFNAPFTAVKHPFDNCVYVDAKACLESGRGEKSLLERQVALYKAVGVPRNNGLIASGVLMRQNTKAVTEFCRTWWEQVRRWSNRDQVAYGYANFVHPGVINLIEWNYTKREEFIHVPHLGKSWRKYVVYQMRERNGKA